MTLNPIGGTDLGASDGLRRWMDALADPRRAPHLSGAGLAAGVGGPSRVDRAVLAPAPATVDPLRLHPDATRSARLDAAALDAHAAVGELATQRDTYVEVERALARAGERLGPVLADVDRAYAQAARRDGSPAGDDAARTVVHDAVSAAAREFAATDRRLTQLEAHARLAVRETAERVAALADDVAADNRARVQRRRERVADARDDAAAAQDERVSTLRRDAAVRELGRLVGAVAEFADDGTVDVRIGDDDLVRGDVVDRLVVTDPRDVGDVGDVGHVGDVTAGEVVAADPRTPPAAPPADRRGDDRAPAVPSNPDEAAEVRTAREDLAARAGRVSAPAEDPAVRFASGSPVEGLGGVLAAAVAGPRTAAPRARAVLDRLVAGFADEVATRQAAAPTATGAAEPALVEIADGRPVVVAGPDAVALPSRPGAPGVPGATASPVEVPARPSPTADADATGWSLDDAASVADAQGRFAAGAAGILQGLLADVTERRLHAERTLDVLGVVDAVLSGAPSGQVGGLVRAALGAVDAPPAGAARAGQALVSALQALNSSTTALGESVGALAAWPDSPRVLVTGGDPRAVVAVPLTPGNSAAAGGAMGSAAAGGAMGSAAAGGAMGPVGDATSSPPGAGPETTGGGFGGLLGAVAAWFDGGARAPGSSPAQPPLPPFAATLEVLGVARSFSAVTQSPVGAGQVLGGGRPFSVAVLDHGASAADGGPVAHRLAVGAGTTLAGLAAGLDSLGTSATFSVLAAGPGQERLLVTARTPGAGAGVELLDGRLGVPSPVLGPLRVLDAGADTAVRVTWEGRDPFVATSPTATLDGALPGMRLLVPSASAGARVDVIAHPEAARLADEVERATSAAGAVLDVVEGRGAVPAADATALRSDPQVAGLAERIAASLAGAAVVAGPAAGGLAGGAAGAATALGASPAAVGAVPGIRLQAEGSAQRFTFAREAFLRAIAQGEEAVEGAARSLGRDLGALAREASDLRVGFLPVRIVGEQALVHDYSTQMRLEDRDAPRQDVVERRHTAMQSLLTHLIDERAWLRAQLT
ncbi:FlgK family flagellar hook-associated protein [Agilicoccus flavus]|uniref:FlgK family flagellar hook-associated protein n=1 Tax=Agilicoccus flavus TaxID=2775968 RepID=UPI001CF696AA|nr:hypothetical protein [Agilicoccus flavus]